ncbi:MAG TPA: hypothetical protein VIP54_08260 [Microterricola sp.]
MTALPAVRGAHLVGSINQPTAAATLRVVAENLGADIARIPDGEVGERYHWILFQGSAFDAVDGLVRVPIDPIVIGGFDVRPLTLDGTVAAEALEFGPLGYADAAIASYAEFTALKGAGVIAPGTRFQVSVPSPLAALSVYVVPAERPLVYPAYSAAITRDRRDHRGHPRRGAGDPDRPGHRVHLHRAGQRRWQQARRVVRRGRRRRLDRRGHRRRRGAGRENRERCSGCRRARIPPLLRRRRREALRRAG